MAFGKGIASKLEMSNAARTLEKLAVHFAEVNTRRNDNEFPPDFSDWEIGLPLDSLEEGDMDELPPDFLDWEQGLPFERDEQENSIDQSVESNDTKDDQEHDQPEDDQAYKRDAEGNVVSGPPNSEAKIDGKMYYFDDAGKVYRVDDDLLPNNTYEINGYCYDTDEKGRISHVSGQLQRKDHDGRPPIKDSMDKIGKGDQRASDDRGHLVADRFQGGDGLENIVPMDSELNRHGDYRKLEDMLADALKDGATVHMDIEITYDGNSNRPSGFQVTVVIDGEKDVYYLKNGEGS
jgi:hypothetical protein